VRYIEELWQQYDPQFAIADDGPDAYLSANDRRVVFDGKTLMVDWLLSFAGWRALECYGPAVICSLLPC
jgi:hypothetical protein